MDYNALQIGYRRVLDMVKPVKKIPINVYAPAGKNCAVPDYTCPMLQDMSNTPACFCMLIPDSWWWNYEFPFPKNKLCPALLQPSNILTDEDIKNQRLRIIKKSIKHGTLDSLMLGNKDGK
jgi:hypothetical protein